MPRPTKEQREQAAIDRTWRKITDEHAAGVMAGAIALADNPTVVRNADNQGGHVVEIRGPDGEWRRYYVRLTEVQQ